MNIHYVISFLYHKIWTYFIHNKLLLRINWFAIFRFEQWVVDMQEQVENTVGMDTGDMVIVSSHVMLPKVAVRM